MKQFSRLISFTLLSVLMAACQGKEQNSELKWGETAETEMFEITPTDIQVNQDSNETEFIDVDGSGKEVIIDLEIKNTSGHLVKIDRDFYYHSFGVLHEEEVMKGRTTISRMDIDIMPFPIYQGDLDEEESIETQIILFMDVGELFKFVFDTDRHIENENYEVSWKIESNW
ncbi:hypothetical protein [Salisediminibacterium selenitireducens]|uniref:DUF4352 domain-containing protein n=1 Tax=Bacillus selenitireducens (strain ATCC 700615 / DSM 15326 / MLS10) TaxID=439292 RepID=D6XZW3_BACIE|nr:hypothetical protein [Salisediminibacterium selenitireducens]ADI00465.1 hypothetical protein Bsel_2981 [[Bacillus] selenitireducens MLS10]